MSNRRVARVSQRIHQEISQLLLTEVKDPQLSAVQITGVEVSPDLQIATVDYTVIGDVSAASVSEALGRAQGFLRREIAKRVQLRRAPELRFKADISLDRGHEMDALLRKLRDDGQMGLEPKSDNSDAESADKEE